MITKAAFLIIGLFVSGFAGSITAEAQSITQVTSTSGPGLQNDLALSGDGRHVVFRSSYDLAAANSDGNVELFLWSQDSGFTQITNSTGTGFNGCPSINFDGSRLAFTSEGNLFIWMKGSGLTLLTNTGSSACPIDMNSDGTRVAFWSNSDLTGQNSDRNTEVFLWIEGQGVTQITNTVAPPGDITNRSLSISGDGKRIAFVSNKNLTGQNSIEFIVIFLWTEDFGFTQITPLFDSPFFEPEISKDGTKVAFVSRSNITGQNVDKNQEVFLWSEGLGIVQLTDTIGEFSFAGLPQLNGDGTVVGFASGASLTGEGNGIFTWSAAKGFTRVAPGCCDLSIDSQGSTVAFFSSEDLAPGAPGNADRNIEVFVKALISSPPPPPSMPALSTSPGVLDFGNLVMGESRDLPLMVQNSGGGTLTGGASTSLPFSIVGDNLFSLGANQSKIVTVRFSPTSAATFNGNVSITSNAGNTSVTLNGTGVTTEILPTATWTTPPPSSITAGQNFTIAWTTTESPTHVNIHWNPTDPLAPGCCLGPSDTTNSSTVSPTTSPATLTAPTKNADGTPITVTTVTKYVVHVSNASGAGNSAVVSIIVNPAVSTRPVINRIETQDKKLAIGAGEDIVNITGNNFGLALGTISFGGKVADVLSWKSTKIVVRVPPISTSAMTKLKFPLAGTPASLPINSVFDHYMKGPSAFYKTTGEGGGIVQAFSGELGRREFGVCTGSGRSYRKNSARDLFNLGGLAIYRGSPCGSSYLQYDGHTGIDYNVGRGTKILAAGPGIVKIPGRGEDNVYSDPQKYKAIVIEHSDGFETWYLHPRSHLKSAGQAVSAGDEIAEVGCEGLKNCNEANGTGPYHLHFEVRRKETIDVAITLPTGVSGTGAFTYSVPVDPYGWHGVGQDPYIKAPNLNLWEE